MEEVMEESVKNMSERFSIFIHWQNLTAISEKAIDIVSRLLGSPWYWRLILSYTKGEYIGQMYWGWISFSKIREEVNLNTKKENLKSSLFLDD